MTAFYCGKIANVSYYSRELSAWLCNDQREFVRHHVNVSIPQKYTNGNNVFVVGFVL